ncbi:hypothetical protein [Streptomyces sp. NPDC093149]|uniref:hypothetical protein n=1 Tax=Streptomyces sp. NPDC093149 TaxID=3366031 RepID=UPI0037FCDA76
MIKTVKRVAAFAALALMPLAVPATTAAAFSPAGGVRAEIDCPPGYVCIYPRSTSAASPGSAAPSTAASKTCPP